MSLCDYERASLSTDAVLFRVVNLPVESTRRVAAKALQVLLVRRDTEPHRGMLALPGGIMGIDETLEGNIRRKLTEKVGISDVGYLSQLRVYDALDRDERGRVVSLAFLGLTSGSEVDSEIRQGARWFSVSDILDGQFQLAFDHEVILKDALARLQELAVSSDVLTWLLPECFTMADYRLVTELVLGRPVSNFRRWAEPYVEATGVKADGSSAQFRTPGYYTRRKSC